MKYDILSAFREHLNAFFDNKNTADRYYFSLTRLMNDLQFDSLSEIPAETLENLLSNTRTKNEFSAAKNALQHLKAFDKSLNMPSDKFLRDTAAAKRNRSFRPAKTIEHDTVSRKVNALRDNKLKLAFRLMEKSGLRVSETAALEKRDIAIDGENITITVKHGKGGSNGVVECMADKWLADKLTEHLKTLGDGDNPFYSAKTMKNKAGKLGLECHNFRRIAAITHRDARRVDGIPLDEANEDTKDFLRHARFAVTKRYLRNRKLKFVEKTYKKRISKIDDEIKGEELTFSEKEGIIDLGSGKMTETINSPIEQRHTGKGISSAILHYDVELNNRQKELLDKLPDYDSRVTVPKNSANMFDLSALTAKTGVEYAMFTKGNERLIIRGNERRVNVNGNLANELSKNGYRWSGHTHLGIDGNSLQASRGDYYILNFFKQKQSVIYNSMGNLKTFEKE